MQILSKRERVELTESPRAYPDADLVLQASAVGWVERMKGYGVETRAQRKGGSGAPPVPHPVTADASALDNGRVRIVIDDRGAVHFIDHERGRRIDNVVSLERRRDVGDLYTPALREMLSPATVRRVRLVHPGPLRGEIAIDYNLGERAGGGVCRVAIQLDANARALRLIVSGENRERDQRLRLRVATGLRSASTLADAAFLPVQRDALSILPNEASMEQVIPTAPLHRWVARFTDDAGATLVSDGLAEYESGGDGSVAVTLVRSVGELSRYDLAERPGHAGWPAPTPGAQCLGPFAARFALQLHGADSPETRSEIERFADDELLPIIGETLRSNLLDHRSAGGLELHGDGLAFSAAAPAQRDGWIVLRCVNQRDGVVAGEWRVSRGIEEALRARLDETPIGALVVHDGVIRFEAAPGEIVTILAR
jgi:alpha-mannosidase